MCQDGRRNFRLLLEDLQSKSFILPEHAMRLETLLARNLRVTGSPNVPHVEVEPFACVALIDISGRFPLLSEY
ncbi:hypothetical protein HDU97_009930 [Phlyctochytrium planicorne]|nr:hypothetical protein HDU97_009930 [Phlyctochytrium planicorne]